MIFILVLCIGSFNVSPFCMFLAFCYPLQAENSTHISEEWLSDFQVSVARIRPSSLRGGLGVVTSRPASLSDIGGMGSIKQSLRAAVEWPLLYPETLAKFGLPQPKGTHL